MGLLIYLFLLISALVLVFICLFFSEKENMCILDLENAQSAGLFAKRIFPDKIYPRDIKRVKIYNNFQNIGKKLDEHYTNVLIDGEPHDLNLKNNFDVVVSTKIIPGSNSIYVPMYSMAFAEMNKFTPYNLHGEREKHTKTKFCAFMYSNCDSSYEGVSMREKLFDILQKASNGRVVSLGKCKNTGKVEKGSSYLEDAIEMYKPYKFVISVENTFKDGYITEKILLPLLAGCVPIYAGAPDVKNHFESGCFVSVRDFDSLEKCADRIMYLDSTQGKQEYNDMLQTKVMKEENIKKYMSWFFGGEFYEDLYRLLPVFSTMQYQPLRGKQLKESDATIKVINLEKSVERMEKMSGRLKGLRYERFPAIWGSDYILDFQPFIQWKIDRKMRSGELGIYLSSLELYSELLVDASNEYYAVLEDDVYVTKDMSNIKDIVAKAPKDWDIIFLGTNQVYCNSGRSRSSTPKFTRLEDSCMPGAFGYVIRKKAAQYFVNFAFPMEDPIDGLFRRNVNNLNIYEYEPNIVYVDYEDESTTIHNSTTL